MQDTNSQLGRPKGKAWEDTILGEHGFHSFVHQMRARGVGRVNHHFRLQQNACAHGLASYEYHLPVEQLGLWFPCWEEGLNLKNFTTQGWAQTQRGSAWVGADDVLSVRCAPCCTLKP